MKGNFLRISNAHIELYKKQLSRIKNYEKNNNKSNENIKS